MLIRANESLDVPSAFPLITFNFLSYKRGYVECPMCKRVFGERTGTQPPGMMRVNVVNRSVVALAGYTCNTIVIDFSIPSGIQGNSFFELRILTNTAGEEHPNPGQPYSGTSRTAYLPDNTEGREVLELFQIAWNRRLMFTVGRSITTGRDNCVRESMSYSYR